MAVVLRQVFQHFSKRCQHPSVSTSPEVFLSCSRLVLRINILPIAEIESCLLVIHDAVGILPVCIHLVQILLITCQPIHLRHDGHHHIQRIGPPPEVALSSIGLKSHHLAGTGSLKFGWEYRVYIQIGLETNLPIAEEHIIHTFTVLLVFPFLRILLSRALPKVLVSPLARVVQPCYVAKREECLHVTCMINCRVPKRALLTVITLPSVIHFVNNVAHFLSRPFAFGFSTENRNSNQCQQYR